ncbi:MAG: hypothetical protein E6K53_04015 [Gammaproteobacteria bacterium]|nr:MAG: hypothetical protein E6K53_04015 [Gammaproteobacteria bacterium]
MRLAILPLAALLALSAACSQTAAPPPPQKQKTVWDDQLKAIDKAKGVQQTVDQNKKEADKRLEQSENAGTDASKKND